VRTRVISCCASAIKSTITHIFDIGASMDCNDISVLYAKVMSNNPVDAGASIIEFIIGQHNQNSLLALLASNKDCVTSEQSEDVHGVIGE
jgi:hypothetical protein